MNDGVVSPVQLKPLIVVVGPTGVGKSNLAVRIACRFNGEIVNADSRQIYRYMDIGTAKPAEAERAMLPHHLFDIIEPSADYSLAQYQVEAAAALASIWERRRLPVLAGGSGQYVLGLLEGWQVPRVPPDHYLRHSLEQRAEQDAESVYRQLQELDPDAAAKIDKRNIRRVVRAVEVCLQTGRQFSSLQVKNPPDYHSLWIGLTMDRQALYHRTDARVVEMFRQGLLDETAELIRRGYTEDLPSLSSIGYRQAAQVLRGELTVEEAILKIQNETHRYIRHQYAWFRLNDPRIHWFDAGSEFWPEVEKAIELFLKS